MVLAQTGMELRILLRNGEQLILTLVIPVMLLVLFSQVDLLNLGVEQPVNFLAPGVLALAVMSTAFTGQAIGTGFERHYGVLKRLGTTPLPRSGLLAAKTSAVLAVQAFQIIVLGSVAALLGWSPTMTPSGMVSAALLVLGATAAFSALALLLAGTLRAQATLAAANLVYVILLGMGGVVFPVERLGSTVQTISALLPITALSEGLRAVLSRGAVFPGTELLVLLVWSVGGALLASRFFRWE
ncbi:ABC transporter permease [Lipingzhangella sp. LS1_29]|uniref:Transport permease protein n=1 Tax=Lipingzhangella rawalii TaxID=2055835 RepID=A0ABU2H0D0_9ACTN|nr:ABC transporter permease [Lipingzhangella rawalii]MDS1268761.1 ABC transporter permease [Lipingzhangella rawalii]